MRSDNGFDFSSKTLTIDDKVRHFGGSKGTVSKVETFPGDGTDDNNQPNLWLTVRLHGRGYLVCSDEELMEEN